MSPGRRRALAWLFPLLLIVALVVALTFRFRPDAAADQAPAVVATSPPDADQTPVATTLAPSPAAARVASPPAPLQRRPAGDSLLVDLLPRLQALAEGGDADAACRLSVQLLSCQQWQGMHAFFPGIQASLAQQERDAHAEGRLDEADRMASILLRVTEQQRRCEGITERDTGRAAAWLRQSALAGQPEAQLRYASGHGLGPQTDFRFISGEHFQHWRREALPLVQRLLAEGRPEAILLLLEAHSTNGGRLGMLMPADPVGSLASRLLAQRVFGDQPAFAELQMSDGLDAAQIAEAEARAADLHARHFGNRGHDFGAASRGLRSLFDPYGNNSWPSKGASADPAEACGPPMPRNPP